MGSVSPWHLIIYFIVLVFLVGFTFPVVKILKRAGLSGWWAVLWLVPVGSIIGVWIFAYARWPKVDSPNA
jgi:uncharacterized membrane protein YhaH (DUF805 family)